MAERTKFISYSVYSLLISAVVYPISGHWIWGGGWLSQLGFHDFAGSTAVHMVGGVAALVGAAMLGPRIGKYGKDGKPKAILGHSLTLGALGVFILWFGWFGFNPGSTLSATGDDALLSISNIFMTTNIAAAAGACATMIFTWLRYKKPDVSMTLNGALAGLVAITAGCDAVNPVGAALIGLIGGIVVVLSVEFFDKVVKIDDPVGAISVHGVCGALGTLLVGVFAVDGGLLYGGGFEILGIQAIGVFSVMAYVAVAMSIIFFLIKKTIGLRVSPEEELMGLDSAEHGLASSYADFAPVDFTSEAPVAESAADSKDNDSIVTIKQDKKSTAGTCDKITNVTVITKQTKFETLKAALEKIGVTGITVTQVMGCGMQKGKTEFYRGVEVEMNLLPKVKVEIVICKIPVQTVIDTIKKALYTNNIGDGKIFIYDVENAIKVRTGEEGYGALQDEE